MKQILVLQKDRNNFILTDDSETDLDEYCNNLATLLKSANVSIIKTTGEVAITRPSLIQTIVVREVDKNKEAKIELDKSAKEEPEDIITEI
jgi:hypothetical protein